MKHSVLLLTIVFLLISAIPPTVESSTTKPSGTEYIREQQVYFYENLGQLDEAGVVFSTRIDGMDVLFLDSSIVLRPVGHSDVTISFPGSNVVNPIGSEKAEFTIDIYNGQGCFRSIKAFSRLLYPNIYESVDLVLSISTGLKYEFIVHPGGDPEGIGIQVKGAEGIELVDQSCIGIQTSGGVILDDTLEAYYLDDPLETVGCEYVLLGNNQYGFDIVENYDDQRTLVIDPLIHSTFLGGSSNDGIMDMELVDDTVILGGTTRSTDFPLQGAIINDNTDTFISVIDAKLSSLKKTMIISGNGRDQLQKVVIDDQGNLYAVGYTDSTDLPTTANAYQSQNNGENDIFIAQISLTSFEMTYLTYLGGEKDDEIFNAKQLQGLLYLVGWTGSIDFPITDDAIKNYTEGFGNGLISVFGLPEMTYQYGSYFGGSLAEGITDVMVNSNDEIVLCGITCSTDFPVTTDAIQPNYHDEYNDTTEGFLSILNSGMTRIRYSTFLGGVDDDIAACILQDSSDDYIILLETCSNEVLNQTSPLNDSNTDLLLLKYDLSSNKVSDSLFIGGSEHDVVGIMELGTEGDLYLAGKTESPDFKTTSDAEKDGLNGFSDGFLMRLDLEALDIEYSTYFGGSSNDGITSLELAGRRQAYIAGFTDSYDLPVDLDGFQPYHAGTEDAFVSLLSTYVDHEPPAARAGRDVEVPQHTTVILDGSDSTDNWEMATWTWTFTYDSTPVVLAGEVAEFTFDEAGVYEITLNVTDAEGNWATDIVNVTVLDTTPPVARAGDDATVDQHQRVTLDGSSSTDNVGVVNWTWSFRHNGTDVLLYGPTASFDFDVAGGYEVTLRVEDGASNRAEDTLTVTVRDTTPPVADAGEDVQVPQGTTVTLSGSGSSDNMGIANWTWEVETGDGTRTFHTADATLRFDVAGVLTATLTVRDAAGGSDSATVEVTVLDVTAPVSRPHARTTALTEEEVVLDGSNSTDNVGVVGWRWTFVYKGEEVVLEGETTVYTFNRAGEYVINLEVTDAAGNTGEGSVTVLVKNPPASHGDSGLMLLVLAAILAVVVVLSLLFIYRRRR